MLEKCNVPYKCFVLFSTPFVEREFVDCLIREGSTKDATLPELLNYEARVLIPFQNHTIKQKEKKEN